MYSIYINFLTHFNSQIDTAQPTARHLRSAAFPVPVRRRRRHSLLHRETGRHLCRERSPRTARHSLARYRSAVLPGARAGQGRHRPEVLFRRGGRSHRTSAPGRRTNDGALRGRCQSIRLTLHRIPDEAHGNDTARGVRPCPASTVSITFI